MNRNPFGHIDLNVTDHAAAESFFEKFMPAVGLTGSNRFAVCYRTD